MPRKPTLYIETSVVSYLVSRPSRDPLTQYRQDVTKAFWAERLDDFEAYTSALTIAEAGGGDKVEARKRLHALEKLPVLHSNESSETLARDYVTAGIVPVQASADAAHIAIATAFNIDYIITWNLRHIGGVVVWKRLREYHGSRGLHLPGIGTPEQLLDRL